MFYLDLEISPEKGKFVTTTYHKPSGGVYTHFKSFLSSTHKFGMLYTLLYQQWKRSLYT